MLSMLNKIIVFWFPFVGPIGCCCFFLFVLITLDFSFFSIELPQWGHHLDVLGFLVKTYDLPTIVLQVSLYSKLPG